MSPDCHERGNSAVFRPTVRFWGELGVGAVSAVFGVVTLVWPDWLELILHIDPDGGNGSVEWAVVALCALVALVSFVIARIDLRRVPAITGPQVSS
jgi:hypothetical protein